MPDKRLPLLETAGFDMLAQVEAMLREVREYHDQVRRVRELVAEGKRDRASLLLTEGAVTRHMERLRKESLALAETIDNIEAFLAEERASRA